MHFNRPVKCRCLGKDSSESLPASSVSRHISQARFLTPILLALNKSRYGSCGFAGVAVDSNPTVNSDLGVTMAMTHGPILLASK